MISAHDALVKTYSKLWLLASGERMLFVTWGIFLTAGGVGFWMEYIAQKQPYSIRLFMNYCFPWREWKGASARIDVALYFIGKGTDRLIGGSAWYSLAY
jgi:hypothetical protein